MFYKSSFLLTFFFYSTCNTATHRLDLNSRNSVSLALRSITLPLIGPDGYVQELEPYNIIRVIITSLESKNENFDNQWIPSLLLDLKVSRHALLDNYCALVNMRNVINHSNETIMRYMLSIAYILGNLDTYYHDNPPLRLI